MHDCRPLPSLPLEAPRIQPVGPGVSFPAGSAMNEWMDEWLEFNSILSMHIAGSRALAEIKIRHYSLKI